MESSEDFGGLEHRHIEETTPDLRGGEAAGRDARNDAEVVGATFESAPEVGVGGCGGCSDGPGGEDDFVVENIVADEAEPRGEEGETTCLCLCVSPGTN